MNIGRTHYLNKFFILTIFISLVSACSNSNDGIICTEEFRSITIQIIKEGNTSPLTNFYTIDLKKDDTLYNEGFFESYYNVLTDNYQETLRNDLRSFLFEGFIDEEKVVSETFVISADECHVNKESGVEKIILK